VLRIATSDVDRRVFAVTGMDQTDAVWSMPDGSLDSDEQSRVDQ